MNERRQERHLLRYAICALTVVGAFVAGAARGAFSVAGVSEGVWTVGEAFAGVDFSGWEGRVAADAEGLLAVANRVPPMPRGTVAFVAQGVGELPGAFVACTNAVPTEVLGAVPFWRVRVEERVDAATGARRWLTWLGEGLAHIQDVPGDFDAEGWSLAAYGVDGGLPAFVAGDAARREAWFAEIAGFRGGGRGAAGGVVRGAGAGAVGAGVCLCAGGARGGLRGGGGGA